MQKNCDKPEKNSESWLFIWKKRTGTDRGKVDERKTSMERRGDKMVSDM